MGIDGAVACWGANDSNQSSPPVGTFTQVSAGLVHTCGLKDDGTVTCWGGNTFGQLNAPSGTFLQVNAGALHNCAVKTDGTNVCWGDGNLYGQIAPFVTLDITPASIAENGGTATITASLSYPAFNTVTIDLDFSGMALPGIDYNVTSDTITIADGSSSGSVTLTAVNDTDGEGDEMIIMDVLSATNADATDTSAIGADLTDDEPPTVTLSVSNATMGENGGGTTVTASLAYGTHAHVTVNIGFTGSAAFGTDFSSSSTGGIGIPQGSTSGSFTLTGVDDSLPEGDETIILDITSVNNAIENGTQQATVTIIEDDPPLVTLAANGSSVVENGANGTVTASLSYAATADVTVNLAFSGSAILNTDYVVSTSSITIAQGSTSGSIIIDPTGDSFVELDETIIIDIDSVTNATEDGSQQVSVDILNDDQPTATFTPIPPTSTFTAVPPTATLTSEAPTATNTPFAATATFTPDAPTATATSEVPTATNTPEAQGTELLLNGGFEIDTIAPLKQPDNWTVTLKSQDKIKCNVDTVVVAFEGVCAYFFKGSLTEATKLVQKPPLVTFAAGDTLTLMLHYKTAGGTPALKYKVVVRYTDISLAVGKIKGTISTASTDYTAFTPDSYTLISSDVQVIKVQFQNRSTSGKLYIDDVRLTLMPQ